MPDESPVYVFVEDSVDDFVCGAELLLHGDFFGDSFMGFLEDDEVLDEVEKLSFREETSY